jgi:diadenosine tetraphosphate (Ap4A) HIT family hydrolase
MSFTETPAAVWQDLCLALSRACRLVESVLEPERLYVGRFGEGSGEIHFHVFPRTAWLLQQYRRATDQPTGPVSGPLILDWARETYRDAEPPGTDFDTTIQMLKKRTRRFE